MSMNITIRHAAIGAFVATALILGASAGPERSAPLSILPGWNIRAHDRIADGEVTSAPVASLARAFETYGAKALGVALDAVVEVAARLK